jgi:hypothetical protein
MKTLMFYLSTLVLVITMGIMLYYDKPVISPQMLSVDRAYHLIAGRDDTIDIPLYLNVDDHDILSQDRHISGYLSNREGTKKMDIHLINIQLGQKEYYLDMIWKEWIFIYELQVLGHDYQILDLYLEVILDQGDTYRIQLGKLSILSVTEDHEHLDWHSLSARKAPDSLFSRIETIVIEYTSLHQAIDSVLIGVNSPCGFFMDEEKITIVIAYENYVMNRVPIVIYFQDGSIQIIDSFTYLIDHRLLKESGMLVTTYALH